MPDRTEHEHRTVPWRSTSRRGTRADRPLSEIRVALPPRLATLSIPPVPPRELLRARYETEKLARIAGDMLQPLTGFLIRMESVASSRIEQVEASTTAFARAIAALADAGRVRDVRNWIGGSDSSPRDALYVPPPPDLVPGCLADLLSFANRDDVDPLAQAAIVHAPFESIHPFTNGNGRIGCALMGAVLRRRGITPGMVVPVASALAADTDHYFGLLTAYRAGDARAIITDVALCVEVAAREARGTARSDPPRARDEQRDRAQQVEDVGEEVDVEDAQHV